MDGLQRVLSLLDKLEEKNIHYQVDNERSDALRVFFTLVGRRIEVDCFVDRLVFRLFRGDEGVDTDPVRLASFLE